MSDVNEMNSGVIAEFRDNEGKVGGQFEGGPLLLLTTVGARSGLERVNPMMYQAVGDTFAVFGSKAGADSHPDWYHNLISNPQVKVEVGTETITATARTATGAEREEIWTNQKELFPWFADYEAKTEREIPVVILER